MIRLARGAAALALSLASCSPAQILNSTVPEAGLRVTRGVSYGPDPRQKLDIYRPDADPSGAPLPVVVFFYGGTWRTGSRAMYPFVAAPVAQAGAVVVVPDYRLYPQVAYPEFLRDCARATAWVQSHPAETGGGPLFLMGHSAGAYNALMLALDPFWLRQAGADPAEIRGAIGLAGPYDFLPITNKDAIPVFPADPGPDTQPITYARADAPPLLLIAGTADKQVRPRNTEALARAIRAKGGSVQEILYPGIGHIGLVTAFAPPFQWRAPVLHDVIAFLRRHAFPDRPTVAKPMPAPGSGQQRESHT